MASSQMNHREPSLVVCEASRRNSNPWIECYSIASLHIIYQFSATKIDMEHIFFLVGILDHPQIFLSPQHLKKTLHEYNTVFILESNF